jgi:uncharacterized protein YggE
MSASANSPEHTITVPGSGSVSSAPDVVDVSIGVNVTKGAVKDARAAAAAAMSAVIAAVKSAGVPDKDIRTVNLSLNPVYSYDAGRAPRLQGYEYSNTVRVTVRDLEKVSAVVDQAATVGATTIHGISFRIDDPKGVEAQARELALADARARADALAGLAGVSITGVASIVEGSVGHEPPRPMYALGMARTEGAPTPVQAGEAEVTVGLTVSYLIG